LLDDDAVFVECRLLLFSSTSLDDDFLLFFFRFFFSSSTAALSSCKNLNNVSRALSEEDMGCRSAVDFSSFWDTLLLPSFWSSREAAFNSSALSS
jgi:hypothetical protein